MKCICGQMLNMRVYDLEIKAGVLLLFFFFKQKTAYEIYQCDWSSDVCSSDLLFLLRIQNPERNGSFF